MFAKYNRRRSRRDYGQGYFRAVRFGRANENNTGLGLFLAKSVVESMHGELKYERKDNLTVFSATLPLA